MYFKNGLVFVTPEQCKEKRLRVKKHLTPKKNFSKDKLQKTF